MRQRLLSWSVISVALATALAIFGCAEEENRPPVLVPLADAEFRVNQPDQIQIFASDPDGDPLTFDFELDPEPRTRTEGITGRPQIQGGRDSALFFWTPGIADAGEGQFMDYGLTIIVKDDRGAKASERINLRVLNEGVGGSGTLRFVEPPGAGMAHDLSQRNCVDELRVLVKADNIPNDEVEITLEEPAPPGATLSGNGKERVFFWCPDEATLDQSLSHTIIFSARRKGGDTAVTKRFTVRFQRTAGAGCAGDPPTIEHRPPGSFSGPLNYEIEAVITDDVGFKEPPYVLFTSEDPGESVDTSGWQTANFAQGDSGRWIAAVPNLGLADGETARVWYQIVATDNDDPDSTRCDHTTRSDVFSFGATGGGGGGGAQTYGFCEACVTDEQCGGPDDRCVFLRSESFCGRSCGGSQCGENEGCYEVESVDGVVSNQCLPVDLNCGQICTADALEGAAGNQTVDTAATVQPQRYDDLSICADEDYYVIAVAQGQSIRVTIEFDDARGDLDLAMNLPGDDDFPYQSLNGGVDSESVHEPCVPMAGDAIVAIFPYQDASNRYAMTVEVGAGDCNQVCEDDRWDEGGNDEFEDFAPVELPFSENGLMICREDADYFGFDARAGDIISASLSFLHRDGDIDMILYRSTGQELGRSLSYRDAELIEAEAPMDDIYVLAVYGATRSVANTYDIRIGTAELQGCETTNECPVGTYCAFDGCSEDVCQAPNHCVGPHHCVAPRAGLDVGASGGRCAADCLDDLDCREGFTCKRFEDFSTSCAPAGAGRVGQRCAGYQDCVGDLVCFAVPGGYCAAGGCDGNAPCPDGTVCGDLLGNPACLLPCQNDGDCRAGEGYTCNDYGGRRACGW